MTTDKPEVEPREKTFIFVIWFLVTATTLLLAYLAWAGMVAVPSGPDSMIGLLNIPNIIILIFCAIVGLVCIFNRPKFTEIKTPVLLITVIGYFCITILLFCYCPIYGSYTLHVRVVDYKHNPLPGIPVSILCQKGGFDPLNALIHEKLELLITNDKGEVSTKANLIQHCNGIVNGLGTMQNTDYRLADFDIPPSRDKIVVTTSCSSEAELDDNCNMRHSSSTESFKSNENITVFLPQRRGEIEKSEHLITYTWNMIPVAKDGTPTQLDLYEGPHHKPQGSNCIQFEIWTHDEGIPPNGYHTFPWKCRLSVPGGCLQPRTNATSSFQAPKDGYLSESIIEMTPLGDKDFNWKRDITKDYYFKFADGRYARAIVNFRIGGYNQCVSVISYLNPEAGHTNL